MTLEQVLGFIIREIFYVPVDFRYGIIIVSTVVHHTVI